jgi:hypothetical protein
MTPRSILLIALAAVAALALPAAASAQGAPKPPKFRVQIQATQTTTYKQPYFKQDLNCFSRPWSQGQGSEIVTMKGSGVAYVQSVGKSAAWTYNSPVFGPAGTRGIKLRTAVSRTKSYRHGVDAGPCGGGEPAKDDTFECSPKTTTSNGLLSWTGRRLKLLTTRAEGAPRADFANCQAFYPETVSQSSVTEIGQTAPAGEVTNPAYGKQIILARKSFRTVYGRPDSQKLITNTTVRWQITLYRVK